MGSIFDPQYSILTDSEGDTADVNSDGSLITANRQKFSYTCAPASIALATSCTDAMTIQGSATKTIRILRIALMGLKTTAGQELIAIIKRSTPNTGGTFTAGVNVPHDSQNPTATATVNVYTVNPVSIGTLIGFVRTSRVFWPAAATATAPTVLIWDFTAAPDQQIVLRGLSETLAINLQSGSVAGDIMYPSVDWTEE